MTSSQQTHSTYVARSLERSPNIRSYLSYSLPLKNVQFEAPFQQLLAEPPPYSYHRGTNMGLNAQHTANTPSGTKAESFEETPASPTNTKASIGEYMDATLDFSTNIALAEIRDEGSRWRSMLKQLYLTLQTTAEEIARSKVCLSPFSTVLSPSNNA